MSKLSKAMDQASCALAATTGYNPDLVKAGHDAMHHHAVHAVAAAKAGKMGEAGEHRFMHLSHALATAKGKGYYDMDQGMRRNMDHYSQEASSEVHAASRDGTGPESIFAVKQMQHMHPAEKHFRKGGKFVPHPADKALTGSKK